MLSDAFDRSIVLVNRRLVTVEPRELAGVEVDAIDPRFLEGVHGPYERLLGHAPDPGLLRDEQVQSELDALSGFLGDSPGHFVERLAQQLVRHRVLSIQ
jgi:hypothetical protein